MCTRPVLHAEFAISSAIKNTHCVDHECVMFTQPGKLVTARQLTFMEAFTLPPSTMDYHMARTVAKLTQAAHTTATSGNS